jgi:hypothetical protein
MNAQRTAMLEYLKEAKFLQCNEGGQDILAIYKDRGVIDPNFDQKHVQVPDGDNKASLHGLLAIYFGQVPSDWVAKMTFRRVSGRTSPWSVRTMEPPVSTEED